MAVDPGPVRVREAGTGPATAATHRCVWGALAAGVAFPTLGASGVAHAQLAAGAVGLLTVLPRVGPALGILLAGVLSTMAAPLVGLVTAVLVGLVGLPAQHLPRRLGPLSAQATAASVVFGGVLGALPGAIVALLASAFLANLRRSFGCDG